MYNIQGREEGRKEGRGSDMSIGIWDKKDTYVK